jgi:hypothetical protein
VDLGKPLRDILSEADCALGRLDGAVLTLPNPDLFVFMIQRGVKLQAFDTAQEKNRRQDSEGEKTQSAALTC